MKPTGATNRGASSTLGVVLLVALALALSVVVASYGFGLSGSGGAPASAVVDVDERGVPTPNETAATVHVTYRAGTVLDPATNVRVLVDGTPVADHAGVEYRRGGFEGTPEAGATVVVQQRSRQGLTGGEVVSVVAVAGGQSVSLARTRLTDLDVGDFPVSVTCPFLGTGSVEVAHNGPGLEWEKLSVAVNGEFGATRVETAPPADEMNAGDRYVRHGSVAGAGCAFQRWNVVGVYYETADGQALVHRTKARPGDG